MPVRCIQFEPIGHRLQFAVHLLSQLSLDTQVSNQDDVFARLERAISVRCGEDLPVDRETPCVAELVRIAEHRSYRRYASKPIDPRLLRVILACAFSTPSKSDLHQAGVLE